MYIRQLLSLVLCVQQRVTVYGRFVVLHVFLSPVPSSFVRPHAQGSLAVWDSEGLVLSPLTTALVVMIYAIAGPSLVVVIQVSTSWSAVLALTTWVSSVGKKPMKLPVHSLSLFYKRHDRSQASKRCTTVDNNTKTNSRFDTAYG